MTVTATNRNPTDIGADNQRNLVNPRLVKPRNLRMFRALLASTCLRPTFSRILALILPPLVFRTNSASLQPVAKSIHRTRSLSRLSAVFLLSTDLAMVRPIRTTFQTTISTIFWRLSQLDKRTRRSRAKTAADRRSVRPLRRPSNSPSALVLSPMTPPTNPPSFIPPCVRRLCLTVINHRPSRGWTRLVEKVPHHDTSTPTGSGGVLELFSVIPLWCNVLDYYPVPGRFNRAGPKWLL